ncbi:MAG: AAA family ATPase [Lachnospiraceae bacterium]|jgi:hypothetical protein|nr:AAA family ATPase [Lachnospiraceae bacterium]
MKTKTVRLTKIEITNFKNVEHGVLSFENTRKAYSASILGLYGQNGSGKTALIDALSLLKYALTGQSLPASFVDFVNVNAEHAKVKYTLQIANQDTDGIYDVQYELCIRKEADESGPNIEQSPHEPVQYKAAIFDEVLACAYQEEGKKYKLQPVVDTRTEDVFGPASKYKLLVGHNAKTAATLLAGKQMAALVSKSFIFSAALLNVLRKNCKETLYLDLFESLIWYGNYELFVINTARAGLITMNTLPLTFQYKEGNRSSAGSLMIHLNAPSLIPQEALERVEKVVRNMNGVLVQLVPGLTIGVKNLGTEMFPTGDAGIRIQLVSRKNSKDIPLQYESEGIKKIVSVLQLLIVVYNQASITVAIDELDAGVFEYLLGELLRIISEKGKGQLIFTSHNLRPLETLDKGFIAFTTSNPRNRYIRFANIKTNHNLRDFYYRDIVLGEQSESVYEPTDNYEIALAFREAGELSGS